MVYGRRFFENQEDISNFDHSHFSNKKKQDAGSAYQAFRTKYILYLIVATVGSLLIFILPTIFFIKQNYKIFETLAYDVHPQLLIHLDREYEWLLGFMVISVLALCLFGLWIGIRITNAVIQPLNSMENHMKQVIVGNLETSEFRQTQASEDLQSLFDTYNYLYKSLRAQTTLDIRSLQKIVVDPSHREAYQIWKNLLQNKQEQVGQTNVDLVLLSVEVAEKRHAS